MSVSQDNFVIPTTFQCVLKSTQVASLKVMTELKNILLKSGLTYSCVDSSAMTMKSIR
jgi:hypothetical protein